MHPTKNQLARAFAKLLRPYVIVDSLASIYMTAWNTESEANTFCRLAIDQAAYQAPLIRAAAHAYEQARPRQRSALVLDALNYLRVPYVWPYCHRISSSHPHWHLPLPRYSLQRNAWEGSRVLNLAAGSCPLDFLEFLESQGSDVMRVGACRQTVLIEAMRSHVGAFPVEPVIDWMLSRGVPINHQDAFGRSALHWAAQRGATRACLMLLERGADPTALDIHKQSVADHLPSHGYTDLHRVIEEAALSHALSQSAVPARRVRL